MKKTKLLLCAVMLLMAVGVSAQTYTRVDNNSFTDGTLLFRMNSYNYSQRGTASLGSREVAVSLYHNDNPNYYGNKPTSVTIPTKVTYNGNEYTVVAIAYAGFCYHDRNTTLRRPTCTGSTTSVTIGGGNTDLRTVNIASDSQIRDIGEFAFAGCVNLQYFMVPKTVTIIRNSAFDMCRSMKIDFQTNADGTSALRTMEPYCLYDCESIETLVLPEGLVTIGDRVLQYTFGLINITLPNTVTTIGEHFLCCSSQLQTLIIPASVTSMAGACFHGCESLREVYMLGTAGSLKSEGGTSGSTTFGENDVFCKDAVSNCKFYTTEDYIKSYAQGSTSGTNQSVWYKIADNRDRQGYLIDENGERIKDANGQDIHVNGSGMGNNNWLLVIEEVKPTFTYKWVTACFPEGLKNYKTAANLGTGAMVAEMVSATAIEDDPWKYHLTFRLIEGDDIPAGKPYLICPSQEKELTLISAKWYAEHKEETTVPHITSVNADNGAIVQMISYYTNRHMQQDEFFFKSTGEVGANKTIGNFSKVAEQSKAPDLGACKAFWRINIDGVINHSNAKLGMFFDDDMENQTTGIENAEKVSIVIDAIYDVNGNKLNIPTESLPKGLYIINGKKVFKNK